MQPISTKNSGMSSGNYQLVESPKKRCIYIDTLGGIFIIMVVILHCFQWARLNDCLIIMLKFFGFWIAWFFYKAGMFFKRKEQKPLAKKIWERLGKPYVVFSFIGLIVFAILKLGIDDMAPSRFLLGQVKSLIITGAVPANLPLWFFVGLIFSRLIYNYLVSTPASIRYVILTLCFFLPIFIFLYNSQFPIPDYLSYVPMAVAFVFLGHKFREIKINWAVLITILALYIGILVIYPTRYGMFGNVLREGSIWLVYPLYFSGIIIANEISRRFLNIENVFSKIGRNTLPIFCLHWIVIVLLTIFYPLTETNQLTYLIVLLIGNLILLPLFIFLIKKTKFRNLIE